MQPNNRERRGGKKFVERLSFEERLRDFLAESKLILQDAEEHAYHKTPGEKRREKKRRSKARASRRDD